MQLQYLGSAGAGTQPGSHMGHFPGAGNKHQGINGRIRGQGPGVCGRGRVRNMVQEAAGDSPLIKPRSGAGHPGDLQRMQGGGATDHRRRNAVTGCQKCGKPVRVQGGGHGHQDQVLPKLADLGQHAHQQIRFEAAFVHFIEDDGSGVRQTGVGKEAAQQDAGGYEFDQCPGACPAFPADGVADPFTERGSVQGGQPAGR